MDSIDYSILMALQEDATISIAALAAKVGLSQTPCWKRIQKLEQNGVILGRVALVAPEEVGLGLTVFVQVETADHSAEWLHTFATGVAAMPEVVELYRMAGDVDYMLRVVVPDMGAYDRFYRELIARFALKNVTSRFAMERLKQTSVLPIPKPERRYA
jgi:Lrp/AsnC family transcriptional regulator